MPDQFGDCQDKSLLSSSQSSSSFLPFIAQSRFCECGKKRDFGRRSLTLTFLAGKEKVGKIETFLWETVGFKRNIIFPHSHGEDGLTVHFNVHTDPTTGEEDGSKRVTKEDLERVLRREIQVSSLIKFKMSPIKKDFEIILFFFRNA